MQIARKLNPSCDVQPEKTKAFQGTPRQIGTPNGTQHDKPAGIRVSGDYQASSRRDPPGESLVSRVSGRDPMLTSLLANSWQKSIQNGVWETSQGTQNRTKISPGPSWDIPWRPRESRKHPRSVSEASWRFRGVPRERPEGRQVHLGTPKRTPGSVQERAEAAIIDAKSGR